MRHFVDDKLTGEHQILGPKSANYLGRTMRLRAGDRLVVFNGAGLEREATVVSLRRDRVELQLGSQIPPIEESAFRIRLLQAITKGDAMDLIVQKATELGVQEIVPVVAERSVVRLVGDRIERRMRHWRSVAVSACEQSGRHYPIHVRTPARFDDAVSLVKHSPNLLLLDPKSRQSLTTIDANIEEITMAIGPEGGFTEEEILLAGQNGFATANLGPRVLRAETASIAACALVQARSGDLGSVKPQDGR